MTDQICYRDDVTAISLLTSDPSNLQKGNSYMLIARVLYLLGVKYLHI